MEQDLNEITQQMDCLKDQKARLEFELKQVGKEIEKIELILGNHLNKLGVDSIDFGPYTFGWKVSSTRKFNQKLFGEAHPDLLEKFKTVSKSKKFDFKINK